MHSYLPYWRKICATASAALALAGAVESARAQAAEPFSFNFSAEPRLIPSDSGGPPLESNLSLMPQLLMALASDGESLRDDGPMVVLDAPSRRLVAAAPESSIPAEAPPAAPSGEPPDTTTDSEPSGEETERPAEPSGEANVAPPLPETARESVYGGVFDLANRSGDPRAPAWIIVPRVGLEEIFTDNVNQTSANHRSDVISRLSAGVDISADTPHLRGVLDATGFYQRAINAQRYNKFSLYGFGDAEATLVPDLFLLDLRFGAHEIERDGLAPSNPALISPSTGTQTYSVTASPDIRSRIGDFGFADLRYAYSQLWVEGNTQAVGPVGPLRDATRQQARADFIMPGTMTDRLLSDLLLSGSSDQINRFAGTFQQAFGEFINELHLTRSISAIAGGGYEALSDPPFPDLNGQGAIWDLGGRWRPNADSDVVVLWGRHDLKTGISGEVHWRLTPSTAIYASHTDSINSTQQSLILNNLYALLGPEGPAIGVTPGENPTIAGLRNITVGSESPSRELDIATGIPIDQVNNFLPAMNGFFRINQSRAAIYSDIAGQKFSLTAFHMERLSLTGRTPPISKSNGLILASGSKFSENLFGHAEAGYRIIEESDGTSDFRRTWAINFAASLTYTATPTLDAGLRFDHFRKTLSATDRQIITNALTLSLRKRF